MVLQVIQDVIAGANTETNWSYTDRHLEGAFQTDQTGEMMRNVLSVLSWNVQCCHGFG